MIALLLHAALALAPVPVEPASLVLAPLVPGPLVPAPQDAAAGAAGAAGLQVVLAQEPAPEAAPVAADLDGAVAAYRAGRYGEAAELFAQLAEAEPDPARAGMLHCNAGTAAARAEQNGAAVWHLRRARQLLPRDTVTAINLERVTALLGASDSEAAQFARTLRELPLRWSAAETATLCCAVAGLALVLLAAWRTGRAPRVAAQLGLLLLAASASWWFAARTAHARDRQQAVVLEHVVNGRAEPDELGEILFRLNAGAVVSEEEERGDWRLVQADAGARGWVPAAQVRPLR